MTEALGQAAVRETGRRTRVTIDVAPELRYEIRMEAARRDVSITHYVIELIRLGRNAERVDGRQEANQS